MVFCGKCGFQLTSGNITCPRCGTPTDTELISGESQPDSPTIAASTNFRVNQPYAGTQETISPSRPMEQQPLILGSHPNDYGIAEQMANEATNRMGSQNVTPGQRCTIVSWTRPWRRSIWFINSLMSCIVACFLVL